MPDRRFARDRGSTNVGSRLRMHSRWPSSRRGSARTHGKTSRKQRLATPWPPFVGLRHGPLPSERLRQRLPTSAPCRKQAAAHAAACLPRYRLGIHCIQCLATSSTASFKSPTFCCTFPSSCFSRPSACCCLLLAADQFAAFLPNFSGDVFCRAFDLIAGADRDIRINILRHMSRPVCVERFRARVGSRRPTLVGLVSSYTLGGFIHILLVIAVVVIIVNLVQGRRVL